jgi:hypothetical protein
MSDITQARTALVARILEGDGSASHAQRRAAFDNAGLAEPLKTLIDKVAKQRPQDHPRGYRRGEGMGPQRGPNL